MKDKEKDQLDKDELQSLAALYALGGLTQHEARFFERIIAEGHDSTVAELGEFEAVTGLIGMAAPESSPASSLRDALLERISEEAKPAAGTVSADFFNLRANQGDWNSVAPGISIKKLFIDESSEIVTSLVRMEAGTGLPPHKHLGVEQIFILEGDCSVHGTQLGPGDFHRAAAGSVHETTLTVEGTMFLLIAPREYQFYQ